MSGEPREKTRADFIPPPIDGLNLIQPDQEFDPRTGVGLKRTEATVLQNYLVFDDGIYERGPETLLFSKRLTAMLPFYTMTGTEKIIAVESTNKVYLMASPTDSTPSNITGAVAITSTSTWQMFNFNKHIFGMNEVDAPWIYDIAAGGNVAATGLTGPTLAQLATGWNFKKRAYFLEGTSGNPTKVWYGAVDAFAGALTAIDYASVLERPGYLLTGFSWGYNQGLQSDELLVLISNSGEVLFYSGDWPDAANIQLIARANIPKPTGRSCYVKFGQEVFISTIRGLIPLSRVFAGRSEDAAYFSASRNLGVYGIFNDRQFALDPQSPFLFGANVQADSVPTAGSFTLYAQNYERGAWSTLQLAHNPQTMCCAGGYLVYSCSYTDSGFTGHTETYALNIKDTFVSTGPAGENTATTASKCIWTTPSLNLGSYLQKKSNFMRPRASALSGSIAYSASINGGGVSSNTISGGEISPPGLGRTLAYTFSKTPAGERNRLTGFDANWDEGGLY